MLRSVWAICSSSVTSVICACAAVVLRLVRAESILNPRSSGCVKLAENVELSCGLNVEVAVVSLRPPDQLIW